MQYGVLCLLPPAAMLIFALKTKKSFEALIFGTLVAYLIMYKAAFIEPWCDLLLSEINGSSFIADATGELVASAGRDTEEILYAFFDLDALREERFSWGLFRDRRPETYRIMTKQ